MLKQIKDLCIFMICGQTLLYFQSGKKYEKICKMILELLVLAGIIGMILNFLQSLGFQKGEMAAAGGAVAGMYFLLKNVLGRETASWLCILSAAPLAVAGFFQYNGLTFEQFLWAFIKSEFLCARPRGFQAENVYLQAMGEKGGMSND